MKPRLLLTVVVLLAGTLRPSSSQAADEWGFDPRFRPLPATDVLVQGKPPLLRRDVDAFVDLVESSFDLAMPRDVESALRVAVEESFDESDEAARQAFLARVAPLPELRRLVREQKVLEAEEGLMRFRRALDTMLQRDPPDAAAKILRESLRRRHDTAWAGDPPIPQAAVDSWFAMAAFVASLARNEEVTPTVGKEAVTRRDLEAAFREHDAPWRKRLLAAHRTWIRVQQAWDEGGELERLKLRAAVVAFVASILPDERRVELGTIENLEGYARAAAVLRDVLPAFDTWSNLAAKPDAVLDLCEAWLGPVPEGLDVLLLYRE